MESNKKIQKLENQLEEERQLNYSFDIEKTNNKQNVNMQEAVFTEGNQNRAQQQEKKKPTETEHKDISEKNKNKSIKEDELLKDAKLTEAIKSEPDDREEESPKKGFWSRVFGN